MSYEYLSVEKREFISIVTFNRAARANAVNYDFLTEIEAVARDFRHDAESRVVIFVGAGKHFSAGADIDGMSAEAEVPLVLKRRRSQAGARAINALLAMDQITISAWRGGAIGGGGCLACATDFRIGADDCFLQFPEIDLGLNLMWQSVPLMVRTFGPALAKRLLIGGERIYAPELNEWQLLEALVPVDELMEQALEFAARYAAKSPVAAQMIKKSINQYAGALDCAIMHGDADQNILTFTTSDQKQAANAYLNKTEAAFSGD
ncbi:MAG: enoyl-CoA hydratase/isomerase family protein [Pseudomonadota bacterium]